MCVYFCKSLPWSFWWSETKRYESHSKWLLHFIGTQYWSSFLHLGIGFFSFLHFIWVKCCLFIKPNTLYLNECLQTGEACWQSLEATISLKLALIFATANLQSFSCACWNVCNNWQSLHSFTAKLKIVGVHNKSSFCSNANVLLIF